MAEFNFADSYRAAGLSPGPEILRLRREPFDKLLGQLNAEMAIDLTRLYFGLSVPNGTTWFRDAFGETDASFSLIDNQREVSVLASGLLAAAVADGLASAGLAVLTTAVAGLRQPVVWPELIGDVRNALDVRSVEVRRRAPTDPQITVPGESDVPSQATALAQAGDWAKAAGLFKQVSDESYAAAASLATQTSTITRSTVAEIADLREQVEMLWWHIGGFSRELERPFAEVELALAATMAGLDLANLCRSETGPVAAPAIIHRTLAAGRDLSGKVVTIAEAVDALPESALAECPNVPHLQNLPDICPVLTAFSKFREMGRGTAWHASYSKATGIDPTSSLKPLDLAVQVYRERLLLNSIVE